MAKNLVIVESPAKAKTIEGFLGKDFLVKSCFGHIRDLGKSDLSIDVANGYSPRYEVSPDKKQVIAELTKLAKQAEVVWLASDEDREGEAISWHLAETLKLDDAKTRRIVFHEITKPAILKAIESPRQIDINLVNAQQARRILDRLVGYELSPVLWKKVKPSLSAGRVQSVAVRLLVDREREITQFTSESYFRITALLNGDHQGKKFVLKAQLPAKLKLQEEAEGFLNSCIGAAFTVTNIEKKPARRSPSAPFTTSTLQQEASRKLGYSVSQTMVIAQRLYEAGKITYMRTDSVNLSETALEAAKQQISQQFGSKYHKLRKFTTKTKGAQEAHEAIRPTYMEDANAGSDNQEKRLYDLIWKRTLASQMADAELEKTVITIGISGNNKTLEALGEVVVFDGFLKVYSETADEGADEDEGTAGLLPPVQPGAPLELEEMTALQKFSSSPPRYTEASLVKKLEELGIGRPSTYAPTISTIQKRNYVVKEDREGVSRKYTQMVLKGAAIKKEVKTEITGAEKNKLFPTDIGTVVNDFLMEHFSQILDFNFTAKVEKEFDEIAEGMQEWSKMIDLFYQPFHADVARTNEEAERATGARLLGNDPKSGKQVYVRIGRYGALAQIGENDDPEKRFANLRTGMRLETVSLEEALDLFKLPRNLGEFEEKDMVVGAGRFGPYIRHNNAFYSLPKTDDPHTVDAERAIEIILAKRKADAEKVIARFPGDPDIHVLNGRFGPYIAKGKENFKIPKGTDPHGLTLEDCLTIIASDAAKPKVIRKKKK
ncbi:MAG: type I DNA topoisomerase [Bacteroidia bacterium]|nr:type I DNA topoisomerase [Bacteroidia bacterium]MCC6768857.1 type I DNA topoisomerase [Bacteroidia bacterium]